MQIQIQQEHRSQIARKYTTQAEIQKYIIQIQMSSAQAKIQKKNYKFKYLQQKQNLICIYIHI